LFLRPILRIIFLPNLVLVFDPPCVFTALFCFCYLCDISSPPYVITISGLSYFLFSYAWRGSRLSFSSLSVSTPTAFNLFLPMLRSTNFVLHLAAVFRIVYISKEFSPSLPNFLASPTKTFQIFLFTHSLVKCAAPTPVSTEAPWSTRLIVNHAFFSSSRPLRSALDFLVVNIFLFLPPAQLLIFSLLKLTP